MATETLMTTSITFTQVNLTANAASSESIIVFTILNEIFCVLISAIGIGGNILVLYAFLSKWAALKTYEIFIVSLAVADLLGTLLFPCIQLHEISGGSFHGIGSVGCKVIYFLSSTSVYVSSLTLIMVSVDRYIAVKWPFKRRENFCRTMITFTWLVGFSCAMVYLFGDRIQLIKDEGEERWLCRMSFKNTTEDFNAITAISLVTFTMQNAIPFFVMTIFYSLIIYELHKNTNRNMGYVSEEDMHRRRKDIKKTTKLLFIVVVVFFICVTPNNIFYILYHFDMHGLSDELTHPVYVVLSMLLMANSCVNPLIYGKLLRPFRRRNLKLFMSCLHFAGLRFKKQGVSRFTSIKTFKTSISKYEPDCSQIKTDICNNKISAPNASEEFNCQNGDYKPAKIVAVGRKISKQSSPSEGRPNSFIIEGVRKMLLSIREQMEDDDIHTEETIYCNMNDNDSLNICMERETIL